MSNNHTDLLNTIASILTPPKLSLANQDVPKAKPIDWQKRAKDYEAALRDAKREITRLERMVEDDCDHIRCSECDRLFHSEDVEPEEADEWNAKVLCVDCRGNK